MVECRLLLIQPSRLSREGLRCILHGTKGVIQDASSAQDYLLPERLVCPDVVIWGPGIPAQTLRSEILALRARFCRMPVPARHLILVSSLDGRFMRQMAKLDVEALLHDDITAEVLMRSIELVTLGQRIFPVMSRREPSAAQAEIVPFRRPATTAEIPQPTPRSREVVLSARENEVLQFLVDGASNKAIAQKLQITEATVKVHVRALFRKSGASNRTQAAIWALNNPYEVARAQGFS